MEANLKLVKDEHAYKPKPFTEASIPKKFWKPEPWDANLPSPGFITDFVLSLRGVATPTAICTWSALFTLSTVLKRDVWIEWFPEPLYPNLYVFVVAPPKTCAKSTAAKFGGHLMKTYIKYIKNPKLQIHKTIEFILSKATPEALFQAIRPRLVPYTGKSSEESLTYRKESNACMLLSELSTFLGKQKYNIGLIEKLTDWYDCPSVDMERTISRDVQKLTNVYLTLFGAITQRGLIEHLPETAFGDGFLSRVIVVYQRHGTRSFPKPNKVEGGPTPEDLAKRLAWIAQNAHGEYHFSKEATVAFDAWYKNEYEAHLKEAQGTKFIQPRLDIILRKVSLLMTIQRYSTGNEISLLDFLQAKKIINATLKTGNEAIREVGSSPFKIKADRVEDIIRDKKKIDRRKLLTLAGNINCRAMEVLEITNTLLQQGKIEVYLGELRRNRCTSKGNEVYKWTENQ